MSRNQDKSAPDAPSETEDAGKPFQLTSGTSSAPNDHLRDLQRSMGLLSPEKEAELSAPAPKVSKTAAAPKPSTSGSASTPAAGEDSTKRRSSRAIKRKRFDDEIVDIASISAPSTPVPPLAPASPATPSQSAFPSPSNPSPSPLPSAVSPAVLPGPSSTPPAPIASTSAPKCAASVAAGLLLQSAHGQGVGKGKSGDGKINASIKNGKERNS